MVKTKFRTQGLLRLTASGRIALTRNVNCFSSAGLELSTSIPSGDTSKPKPKGSSTRRLQDFAPGLGRTVTLTSATCPNWSWKCRGSIERQLWLAHISWDHEP